MQAPRFEVDPLWPKPLPNHWVLGIDDRRLASTPRITSGSSIAAPPRSSNEREDASRPSTRRVLRRRAAGARVRPGGQPAASLGRSRRRATSGPSRTTASSSTTRATSGSAATAAATRHILKFTKDGKFLMQIGKKGARRKAGAGAATKAGRRLRRRQQRPESFGRVAKIFVDAKANEAYIADGYGNKRVAVLDTDTGKMKRYWGAYGNKPDDTPLPPYNPAAPPAQQFRNPVHCADHVRTTASSTSAIASNDRMQVFTTDGKFVKEAVIAKNTLDAGSVWDIAFSKDAQQKYIYMADGENEKVHILDRQTLQELTSSATADGSRASSTACTASRSTRRATSTRRKPTKASACRGSSTRAWRR